MEEVKVRNKKLDEEEFLKERAEVLSMWPTGKEVDIDEAVEYYKSLPDHKVFWKVIDKLHREGRTVVFPRAGTPILEQEIELNKWLIDSGMVFVPVTPDSYCRLCQFERAQQGLEESIRTNQPKLNGYPTVIHGVKNTRKVVDACEGALCQRMTNLDCRLMGEIAFASGITAALEDALLNFGSYEKKSTVEQNIKMCQYLYRLCGYYADRGVIVGPDIDGMTPCGAYPQSVAIVTVITVALLAAEQGVKSMTVWTSGGSHGHMAQDIAAVMVTRKLVREYLDKYGFQDVIVPGVFAGQIPLFPYPTDESWAMAFLCYSAMVAALSGAEAVFMRTIDEGLGIPSKEAHYKSYRAAHWIFNVVREQKTDMADWKEVAFEEEVTEREVRAIIDRVLDLGDGDVAVGLVKAFDAGVMDMPFSSNIHMKGKALGIRDVKGACRYLDFGDIPIPEDIKEFHREKVAEREEKQGKKIDYRDIVDEYWLFSKGHISA